MSAELRALAEAATPGPWAWCGGNGLEGGEHLGDDVIYSRVECISYCYGGSARLDISDADRAFIAAANPVAVVALLDLLAATERVRDGIADTALEYRNAIDAQERTIDALRAEVEVLRQQAAIGAKVQEMADEPLRPRSAREASNAYLYGWADAINAALAAASVPEEPPAWRDPTHGRIDRDIQEYVDEMNPTGVAQRVAIENTLQSKRDRGLMPAAASVPEEGR